MGLSLQVSVSRFFSRIGFDRFFTRLLSQSVDSLFDHHLSFSGLKVKALTSLLVFFLFSN